MTWYRVAFVAFILFIVGGLSWQFITAYEEGQKNYDRRTVTQDIAEQKFLKERGPVKVAAPTSTLPAAQVTQDSYTVELDPYTQLPNSVVVLKNHGTVTARHVRIFIRPYLDSASVNKEDVILSSEDPIAEAGDWVDSPDIAPGQSQTVRHTINTQFGWFPGSNPDPKILFENDAEEVKRLTAAIPAANAVNTNF